MTAALETSSFVARERTAAGPSHPHALPSPEATSPAHNGSAPLGGGRQPSVRGPAGHVGQASCVDAGTEQRYAPIMSDGARDSSAARHNASPEAFRALSYSVGRPCESPERFVACELSRGVGGRAFEATALSGPDFGSRAVDETAAQCRGSRDTGGARGTEPDRSEAAPDACEQGSRGSGALVGVGTHHVDGRVGRGRAFADGLPGVDSAPRPIAAAAKSGSGPTSVGLNSVASSQLESLTSVNSVPTAPHATTSQRPNVHNDDSPARRPNHTAQGTSTDRRCARSHSRDSVDSPQLSPEAAARLAKKLRSREKYRDRRDAIRFENYYRALEQVRQQELLEAAMNGSARSLGKLPQPVVYDRLVPLATPSPPNTVTLSFQISFNTHFGQEVFLVGCVPELGSWDPTLAVRMEWSPGALWTCAVQFSAGCALAVRCKEITYKYIVKNGDTVNWEWGGNHKVADFSDVKGAIHDVWGGGG